MNDDDTGLDIDEEFADLLDGEFDVDEEAEAAAEEENEAEFLQSLAVELAEHPSRWRLLRQAVSFRIGLAADREADDDDDEADEMAAIMSRWGLGAFDVDAFLAEIREEPGVSVNSQYLEVPVRYFVQAQQAGLLAGLEIHVDDDGHPYLMGMVVSGGEQVVVVSRSFVEVEPDEDEEEEES